MGLSMSLSERSPSKQNAVHGGYRVRLWIMSTICQALLWPACLIVGLLALPFAIVVRVVRKHTGSEE